jgi:hypothetical protein
VIGYEEPRLHEQFGERADWGSSVGCSKVRTPLNSPALLAQGSTFTMMGIEPNDKFLRHNSATERIHMHVIGIVG